jgi:Fe2+ or Zn2+ uptake regulation protein
MRQTKHRSEILFVLQNRGGALSASDVHTALPNINLVTIYRNLEAFAEAGTIKKMYLGGNEAQFEYQDHPHHHAVCDAGKHIIHFHLNEAALKEAVTIPDFDIHSIELVIHGACTHAHSTASTLTKANRVPKGAKAQTRRLLSK